VLTPSIVVFGCSFSVQLASLSPSGISTRTLNGSCTRPSAGRKVPYRAARRIEFWRSRAGAVTASPKKYAAAARKSNPSIITSSIRYPRKETIFLRRSDPNAIIPRPMKISMWPVELW